MSTTYHQAILAIESPEQFQAVRAAIVSAFSASQAPEFLRSLERSALRVRDFEGVIEKELLGSSSTAEYIRLSPADQGQIREFYLASLEQVPLDLRDRFFKLYAYY